MIKPRINDRWNERTLANCNVNQYPKFTQHHCNMHHKKYKSILEMILGASLWLKKNKPKIDEYVSGKGHMRD